MLLNGLEMKVGVGTGTDCFPHRVGAVMYQTGLTVEVTR